MKAIVIVPVCPVCLAPAEQKAKPEESCLQDELLFGMPAEITGPSVDGWVPVTTEYRYAGWVPQTALLQDATAVSRWEKAKKQVVRNKNFVDVLATPKVESKALILALPRGSRLALAGEAEDGWQPVLLPDGNKGFVCQSALAEYYTKPCQSKVLPLRRCLTNAARLYLGSQYRWGGKSPAGIDCSGLCSMAYLLCGIKIYRDAKIVEGFPVHAIPLSEIREGDLLYFPGHIAMYLGGGEYIHSTAHAGDNGVVINSLYLEADNFRSDLLEKITAVGSIF